MTDQTLSEAKLSDCDRPLKQSILKKYFKLEGARYAARVNDLSKLEGMNRRQIERYRRALMGGDSPMDSDDDNITVADDIHNGLSGRALVGVVLVVALAIVSAFLAGRLSEPTGQDTDTVSTIRFEDE